MSRAFNYGINANDIDGAIRVKASSSAAAAFHIFPRRVQRSVVRARAGAGRELRQELPIKLDRRLLLLSLPASVGAQLLRHAAAQAGDFKTFLGYSQAPDLYLGYGASKDAPPMYSFEYPSDWEEVVVTKTDKSTMGMDGMVKHPKTRKEQAYVIALGGKDYRDSVLKDAKTSLIVIAGGDPALRQAVTDGQIQQSQKTINGTAMYIYEINSDKRSYLSTIGKKGDTVYALVVTAPTPAFDKDAQALRHIQDTFKLL